MGDDDAAPSGARSFTGPPLHRVVMAMRTEKAAVKARVAVRREQTEVRLSVTVSAKAQVPRKAKALRDCRMKPGSVVKGEDIPTDRRVKTLSCAGLNLAFRSFSCLFSVRNRLQVFALACVIVSILSTVSILSPAVCTYMRAEDA